MNIKLSARTMWVASLVVVLSLAAILIWPTRYRYDRISTRNYSGVIRTDRFSSKTQQFQPGTGWVSTHPTEASQSVPTSEQDLPKSELDKVAFQGCRTKDGSGNFVCELYNGSTWNIREVIVEVTADSPTGMRRQYAMPAMFPPVKPLTDGIFQVWAAPYLWPSQRWRPHLIAAKGAKP